MKNYKLVIQNIKYFFPILFKINKASIFIILFKSIIEAVNNISWIVFPKLILDCLLENNKQNLIFLVLVFAITKLILSILIIVLNNINDYNCEKADLYLERLFNRKVASIDYFKLEDPTFSDTMSYARDCFNNYTGGIYSIIFLVESIVRNTLIGISSVVILFTSNYPIYIVLLLCLIIVLSFLFGIKNNEKYLKVEEKFNKLYVRSRRKQWYYNNSLLSFRNQQTLRAYSSLDIIDEYASDANSIVNKGNKENIKELIKIDFITFLVQNMIFSSLVLGLLIYSSVTFNVSVSVLTLMYGAVLSINSCLDNIGYFYKLYIQNCVYQKNYIDFMESKSIFVNGTKSISSIEKVEFRNVSFTYPNQNVEVLSNISFIINNYNKTSIVGLNGAGKTTLVKLLCRFYEPTSGSILVNDINIKEYNYDDYMNCISAVFQDFMVISLSIRNNICIKDYDEQLLNDVYNRLKLNTLLVKLPNKDLTSINKWYDKKGVTLSGGELQKIALARCLYKNSSLVILDEPTSALDAKAEADIYYNFNEIVGNKLCIFISHRLSSCIFSDNILVLDGSNLVASGKHYDLMKDKNSLYYKMFTNQAEYYN